MFVKTAGLRRGRLRPAAHPCDFRSDRGLRAAALSREPVRVEACGVPVSTDAGLRMRRLRPADGCAIEPLCLPLRQKAAVLPIRPAAERRRIEPSGELQPSAGGRLRAAALSRDFHSDKGRLRLPTSCEVAPFGTQLAKGRHMRAFAAESCGPPIPCGIETVRQRIAARRRLRRPPPFLILNFSFFIPPRYLASGIQTVISALPRLPQAK